MNPRVLSLLILCSLLAAAACTNLSTTCNVPDVKCGEACVDTDLDTKNCGACAQACLAGFVCSGGNCTCPAGSSCNPHACGGTCKTGESCLTDQLGNDACLAGDLFAACFHAGTVIPLLKGSDAKTGTGTMGLQGPQSLASFQDGKSLVALDSLDDTLFVIDRRTMSITGSVVVQTTGSSQPNLVLTRDTRAYVVKSGVATIEVVNLSDPTKPTLAGEVSTGTGSNPLGAAFDSSGKLWVSLWLTGQVIPVTFTGDSGTAGTPVDLPDVGTGTKYPTGVATFGDNVYVTMNHLDDMFAPLAPGFVAVLHTGGAQPDLVPLGDDCLNPGLTATEGTKLWIACTGTYGKGDGEVVALDTTTNQVVTRVATGGAPGRLTVDPKVPGHLYAADAGGGNLIEIHPDGTSTKVDVCGSAAMEFVGDVLAF